MRYYVAPINTNDQGIFNFLKNFPESLHDFQSSTERNSQNTSKLLFQTNRIEDNKTTKNSTSTSVYCSTDQTKTKEYINIEAKGWKEKRKLYYTVIGDPVLRTLCPRTSPSVPSIAIVRTMFSPRC